MMVSAPLVIGLDLGTTLCKAGVYAPDGRQLAQAQSSIRTTRPQPGWAEQDPAEWSEAVLTVMKQVGDAIGQRRRQVCAIGVSAHGPGLVPTDNRFNPLAACPTWQDQRSAAVGRGLMRQVGLDWIGLGMPETAFPAKLAWFQQNRPDIVHSATYILGIKSYLIAFLTGQPLEEPSSGPGGDAWTPAVFEHIGVPLERLAPVRPSLSNAGPIRAEIAQATGLPHDTQVILGLNDGASATLGAGLVRVGQGIVSLSTNGVARTVVPGRVDGQVQLDCSLFCYPYIDGLFVTGGITKCGGDSMRWLLDVAYASPGTRDSDLFAAVEAEASASPPGANGVVFLPYLVGRGTPNSTETPQGAFLKLARHHSRGDLARAVMEGVSFALRDIGETFARLGFAWRDLRLTGGGSRNKVWRQILAEVLDRSLICMAADSVLGAAIITTVALGLHPSVEDAVNTMTQPVESVEPDSSRARYYDMRYRAFQQCQSAAAQIAKLEESR